MKSRLIRYILYDIGATTQLLSRLAIINWGLPAYHALTILGICMVGFSAILCLSEPVLYL